MRNKKFEEIDTLLTTLLHSLCESDYLRVIQANDALKKYDFYAAKVDNGEYPESYLNKINEFEIDEIISYLKEKMTNL